MASTLVKIDIHMVFHVKSTSVTISDTDLPRVFQYIGGIIRGIGGIPMEVGGMPDHIHILASLPKTMTVADFARTIKKDSSVWIKTIGERYKSFAWQEGYGAFSVSPTVLDNIVRYIRNQAEHHKKRTFSEEYILFLEKYGIQYDERYVFAD